jgi:hypothetical protein
MATPSPLSKPEKGAPTDKLWRDVVKLVDRSNAHALEIADLKSRVPSRRPMDTTAGGAGQFRGEYLSTGTYAVGDMVVIASGANAGTYICVSTNPGSGNPPWVGGGYWVKFFSGNALGQWM